MLEVVRARLPMVVVTTLLFASLAGAQEVDVLPPVNPDQALSESESQLDEMLRARVQPIEDRIRELEGSLSTASTPERIELLEEKVALLENLSRAQRARELGTLRTKFTHGYKLVGDMQTKTAGLQASASVIFAYDAIIGLTDPRQYSGFEATFDHLVGRQSSNERGWLRDLLGRAVPVIPPGVTALATIAPALSVASLAVDQLKSLIPAMLRNSYSGNDFVNRYNTLTCGIQVVSQLHGDLITLATTNGFWTERLNTLSATYPTALGDYRRAVVLSGPVSDAAFYAAVEQRFNLAGGSGADEYIVFTESVNRQNVEFENTARRYHSAVLQHIEYWQQTRNILLRTRNSACVGTDAGARARYDAAIVRVDQVINDLTVAYLFNSNDRPENEYFRTVTQGQ